MNENAERHAYTENGIPGGVRCRGCGRINSCVFHEGYWIEVGDEREWHESIKCENCGTVREIVWWTHAKGATA